MFFQNFVEFFFQKIFLKFSFAIFFFEKQKILRDLLLSSIKSLRGKKVIFIEWMRNTLSLVDRKSIQGSYPYTKFILNDFIYNFRNYFSYQFSIISIV